MNLGDFFPPGTYIGLDTLKLLPQDITVRDLCGMMQNEERYVSPSALKAAIGKIENPGFSHSAYLEICKVIDDVPAADVSPVKRGYWKKRNDGTYTCSNCDSNPLFYHPEPIFPGVQIYNVERELYYGSHRHGNFCPFCGALMSRKNPDDLE